ncbi:MAG TPA: asparaginase [Planctomycetes bacterium]|nr:asparaginase [Planctomycetota bacterium]
MNTNEPAPRPSLSRRELLGGTVALPLVAPMIRTGKRTPGPTLVGSSNGLDGMRKAYPALLEGSHPLDVAIEVVKVQEADPTDHSVGLGGLPNEDGVVSLDSACMDAETHNSGAVAAIENILHPCEVARLVMERTDHCLIVGKGAYEFARMHGHPHTELLTEEARRIWLRWKETMSDRDDRLVPATRPEEEKHGAIVPSRFERHGTIHCSALSKGGKLACTTTTSGLAFKIPGRVGDSPIVGAGLYCDQEAGSAGSTGRGEAAILSNGSFACVEMMRSGMHPKDAGIEVLRRIVRQARRAAGWQPSLLREDGWPAFSIQFYLLDPTGRYAGVTLGGPAKFAVADPEGGPRVEDLERLEP